MRFSNENTQYFQIQIIDIQRLRINYFTDYDNSLIFLKQARTDETNLLQWLWSVDLPIAKADVRIHPVLRTYDLVTTGPVFGDSGSC